MEMNNLLKKNLMKKIIISGLYAENFHIFDEKISEVLSKLSTSPKGQFDSFLVCGRL